MKDFTHDGRHAFEVLDALAREADMAGILPVDVHGLPGSATEFVAKVIYYITSREKEIDRLIGEREKLQQRVRLQEAVIRSGNSATLTVAEREAISDAADRYAEITPESAETAATLRGLLERMK